MRPGLLEIIIILIVIVLVLVVTRIVRAGRNSNDKSTTSDEMPTEQVAGKSNVQMALLELSVGIHCDRHRFRDGLRV